MAVAVVFKLLSLDRRERISVCASSLKALKENGAKKLKLSTNSSSLQVFDDSDGTIIDDDECLMAMAKFSASNGLHMNLMLVPLGQEWQPSQAAEAPSVTPATPCSQQSESHIPIQETSGGVTTCHTLESKLPVRRFVMELKDAVNSLARNKNKKLARTRAAIRKKIVAEVVDKKNAIGPGEVSSYCTALHSAYPEGFLIQIKEDMTTNGFSAFLRSVYNAITYTRSLDREQGSNTVSRTRRRLQAELDEDDVEPMVPLLCTDSNGCAENMWAPQLLDKELLEEKRKEMANRYHMPDSAQDTAILDLVEETYPLQRYHINKSRTEADWRTLFANYPALQLSSSILRHGRILLGKNIQEIWCREISDLDSVIGFMEDYTLTEQMVPSKGSQWIAIDNEIKISKAAAQTYQSKTPLTIGCLISILYYFKEKKDNLLQLVSETTTDTEIAQLAKSTCLCPLLIVKGSSIYDESSAFSIVVRGQFFIRCTDFPEAVLILMLSYFVFNISYPREIFKTLEFIQRYFLRINPDLQMRKEGQSKAAKMNAHVSKLASSLSDYERVHSRFSLTTLANPN